MKAKMMRRQKFGKPGVLLIDKAEPRNSMLITLLCDAFLEPLIALAVNSNYCYSVLSPSVPALRYTSASFQQSKFLTCSSTQKPPSNMPAASANSIWNQMG